MITTRHDGDARFIVVPGCRRHRIAATTTVVPRDACADVVVVVTGRSRDAACCV
jgi:hypothetical protein